MTVSLKRVIRFFVFLLPAAIVFGSYAVLFKVPGVGFVNLERICFFAIAAAGVGELVARRRLALHYGAAGVYLAPFVIMLIYGMFSLSWADDFRASYSGAILYLMEGVATLLLIAAVVGSEKDLRTLLRVATVVYAVVVGMGIFEIITGRYFLTQNSIATAYQNGYGLYFPYGPFYNMNDFAAFATLFLPFAVFQTVCDVHGVKGKLLAVLLAAAGVFTVFNASARLCYAALAVLLLAFLAAIFHKKDLRRYQKPILLGGAVLVGLFLLLLVAGVIHLHVLGSEISSAGVRSHSSDERSELFHAALGMIPDSFFLGVGAGNSIPLVPYYSAQAAVNLHDMPLTIFAEYGAGVFLLYAAAVLMMAVRFFTFQGGSRRQQVFSCLCFASVLSFQPTSFASSDIMHVSAIWVVIALWLVQCKLMGRPGEQPAAYQTGPASLSAGRTA